MLSKETERCYVVVNQQERRENNPSMELQCMTNWFISLQR